MKLSEKQREEESARTDRRTRTCEETTQLLSIAALVCWGGTSWSPSHSVFLSNVCAVAVVEGGDLHTEGKEGSGKSWDQSPLVVMG